MVKYEMSGKTIFDDKSPKTQSIDAVKALLAWRGRESASLPSFIEVGKGDNRVVLVLSNKKDAFYTVTAKACSCPAQTFAPGQACKHQRQHFPQLARAAAKDEGSIRPAGGWPGGYNGPVNMPDAKVVV